MSKRSTPVDLGTKVRQLRLQRHWTQARLARALGVTQGQLSKLERGERTFTAEHLVALLKQFNLTLDDLTQPARDTAAQLQNALARQGATHLAETPELLPSAKLRAATVAIREALVSADSARQIAAVAPVFVANAGKINLVRLRNEFAELGLESRLCWAIDSTRAAIQAELPRLKTREWRLKYQHALTVLEATFSSVLNRAPPVREGEPNSYEVLDPEITTLKTLEEVISDASPIAKKWRIATTIKDDEFVRALRAARGSD